MASDDEARRERGAPSAARERRGSERDEDAPPSARIPAGGVQKETEKERLDRNFQELLQGLRVALPGVQVLFAFLLILPFQGRYTEVTPFQEKVYFGTLLCTALASTCLIAAPVRHRLLFRLGVKEWIVFNTNRFVVVGFGFLATAIAGAILLVSDFLFNTPTAAIATAVVAIALGWTWFLAPLMQRERGW